MDKPGAKPFPLSLTFEVGFLGSFEDIVSIALSEFAEDGVKVTLAVQEDPSETVEQLLVCWKSCAFVPVMLILLIRRSDTPVFFMVTVLDADEPPMLTLPKFTDVGAVEIAGAAAWPESFTFTVGFLGSLEEMLRLALLPANGAAGVNVTEIEQDPLAGIDEQPFVGL
jgi:hypothetical protein